jgi:acyl-CoA reductase-like NAD-dependent aldehyde dehydrogenase
MGDLLRSEEHHGAVSREQFERLKGYLDVGKKEGAKVTVGGEPCAGKGYFVKPTLFADVKNDLRIAREKI